MSEGVEKVGNKIDGGGRPFSPDLFLEALEKVWMKFDQSGNPKMPSLIIHQNQQNDIQRVCNNLKTTLT
jgi:hypothetical protein